MMLSQVLIHDVGFELSLPMYTLLITLPKEIPNFFVDVEERTIPFYYNYPVEGPRTFFSRFDSIGAIAVDVADYEDREQKKDELKDYLKPRELKEMPSVV